MTNAYGNFNIEFSERLPNEISTENDVYINCEQDWHQKPKKPTGPSECTDQAVQEKNPPFSNSPLKVPLVVVSILLLCALGMVCLLGRLYAETRLLRLQQEHKATETDREYEALKVKYQRTLELISKFNETDREYEALKVKYQRTQELISKFNESHKCNLCEEGWMMFGVKCYYFSTIKLNWIQSRDHCADKGGHMVIITSQSEQVFLSSHISETHWFGLNDLETEGSWMWVNGEPLSNVTFWKKRTNEQDEPDNWKHEDLSGENCASLGNELGSTDVWFDSSCRKLKKFICEK